MSFKDISPRPCQGPQPPKALVFIPGWAFRGEILSLYGERVSDVGNIRIIVPACPPWLIERREFISLIKGLRRGYRDVFLAGWSLGAVIAHGLLQDISDQLDCAMFISPKARYSQKEIEFIKGYLSKDKAACLRYFYRECFKGQREDYLCFRERLERAFIDSFSEEELLEGLDFLYHHPLPTIFIPEGLRCIFLQGREDRVAPFEMAPSIIKGHGEIEHVIIEDSGHLPFLRWKRFMGPTDV